MESIGNSVVSDTDLMRREQGQLEADQMIKARLNREKKSIIFMVLVAIIFAIFLTYVIDDYLNLPVAYVSWKTGKITSVEDSNGQVHTSPGTIKRLTAGRYEKVWVK